MSPHLETPNSIVHSLMSWFHSWPYNREMLSQIQVLLLDTFAENGRFYEGYKILENGKDPWLYRLRSQKDPIGPLGNFFFWFRHFFWLHSLEIQWALQPLWQKVKKHHALLEYFFCFSKEGNTSQEAREKTLLAIIEDARRQNFHVLDYYVEKHNLLDAALCRKLGFVLTQKTRHPWYRMSKKLDLAE